MAQVYASPIQGPVNRQDSVTSRALSGTDFDLRHQRDIGVVETHLGDLANFHESASPGTRERLSGNGKFAALLRLPMARRHGGSSATRTIWQRFTASPAKSSARVTSNACSAPAST